MKNAKRNRRIERERAARAQASRRLKVKLGSTAFALLAGFMLMGAAWSEIYQNLLVKGIMQIGTGTPTVTPTAGALSVMGTLEAQGAATLGTTVTSNGVVSLKSTTKNLAIATRLPGTTTTEVTVAMPDSTYLALPETNNTSPSTVTGHTATKVTLAHATIGVTDTVPIGLFDY